MANDTTTTLNPGSSGDVMDETLVTQATSGVQAKRARVAVGGDDGSLQTFTTDANNNYADVHDPIMYAKLEEINLQLKEVVGLLKIFLATASTDKIESFAGLSELSEMT